MYWKKFLWFWKEYENGKDDTVIIEVSRRKRSIWLNGRLQVRCLQLNLDVSNLFLWKLQICDLQMSKIGKYDLPVDL